MIEYKNKCKQKVQQGRDIMSKLIDVLIVNLKSMLIIKVLNFFCIID